MNAHRQRNTYVNFPNKSQEILQKKKAVNSKILEQSNDPRIAQPISGLKGTLHVQMQNYRPFNSKSSINQFNRSRVKHQRDQPPDEVSAKPRSPVQMTRNTRAVLSQRNQDLAAQSAEFFLQQTSGASAQQPQSPPSYEDYFDPAQHLSVLPSHIQKLHKLKKTPVTGNTHILLVLDPYVSEPDGIQRQASKPYQVKAGGVRAERGQLHMGERVRYFKGNHELKINDLHYQPCFIAKDVEELRQNPHTRRALKKYKIFEGAEEEEKDLETQQQSSSVAADESEPARQRSPARDSDSSADSSEEPGALARGRKTKRQQNINIGGLSTPKNRLSFSLH